MTTQQRVRRTTAILARAADSLEMDVTVDTQDTDSRDVPTVILMHDGDVTYSIEVPRDEDTAYNLGYGGGLGPNAWHSDLGIAENGNQAVMKLLRKRFKHRVEGHTQAAIRWWNRKEAKESG